MDLSTVHHGIVKRRPKKRVGRGIVHAISLARLHISKLTASPSVVNHPSTAGTRVLVAAIGAV